MLSLHCYCWDADECQILMPLFSMPMHLYPVLFVTMLMLLSRKNKLRVCLQKQISFYYAYIEDYS